MHRLVRFVLVGSLAFVAMACAFPGTPDPTLRATASATPSSAPSATVSGTVSPLPTPSSGPVVPAGLEVGRIAEAVAAGLRVRSLPEISDVSVIDPTSMPRGYLAYIIAGPVTADGYDWYRVMPFPPHNSDVVEGYPRIGWARATRIDGRPWLVPWEGECPAPTLQAILSVPRMLAPVCFGDRELTLDGFTDACSSYFQNGDPAWLSTVQCTLTDIPGGYDLCCALSLYFPPGSEPLDEESIHVRITGHFDDPAASTCVALPDPAGEPTPPDIVQAECRTRFVVTAVERL